MKPFFYAQHNGQLLFGSEVKALLVGGVPARPDRSAWSRYLLHGAYEDQNGSFFSGVVSLPPGHVMVAKPEGKVAIQQYWSLSVQACEQLCLSEDEAAEELQTHLDNAVALRLRSDVPVALNLSGGAGFVIDRSILLSPNGERSGDSHLYRVLRRSKVRRRRVCQPGHRGSAVHQTYCSPVAEGGS